MSTQIFPITSAQYDWLVIFQNECKSRHTVYDAAQVIKEMYEKGLSPSEAADEVSR